MGITRRAALQTLAASSVGLVTGVGAYGTLYARHHLEQIQHDLPITGLPPGLDGLRIGLLTDIHHSDTVPADDVSQAVKTVLAAAPDLVVLGGDYVTQAERRYMNPVAELLAPLTSARLGAFAVLGNHDDDREMPAALEARGISVLKDARTQDRIQRRSSRSRRHSFLDARRRRRRKSAARHRRNDAPPRARPATAHRGRVARRAARPLRPHARWAGRRAWIGCACGTAIPGAGRICHAREHVAVRQPRRRNGVRADSTELSAGRLDPRCGDGEPEASTDPADGTADGRRVLQAAGSDCRLPMQFVQDALDRFRIQLVLFDENPRREGVGGVIGQAPARCAAARSGRHRARH